MQRPNLTLTKSRLRFVVGETEEAYLEYYQRRTVPFVRAGMGLSVIAWSVSAILFPFVQPDLVVAGETVFISLIVLLLVGFGMTYSARARRHLQTAAIVANVVAGVAIVVITDFVGQLHELGPPSIILVAFFAFTIFRMPTGRAALAVGSYLVAYQILLFLRYTEGTISFVEAVYAGMFACNAFVLGLPAAFVLELTLRNSFRQARLIEWERARSERLLRNMLPDPIARRLKEGEETIADGFEGATVLFADIVGFTAMSSDAGADRVVKMLNSVFTAIDDLVTQHGLLKIKTIGDAYMVAAGIPEPRADHATAVADFALDLKKQVATIEGLDGTPLKLRIGMHSGPVVAGVIGKRTVAYDLWGDCVNTASRMESHGQPGEIQITEETRRLLGDRYVTVARDITVKGKGPMRTFLLDGRI